LIRRLVVLALAFGRIQAGAERFYPDDPMWREPRPAPVEKPKKRKIDEAYDQIQQMFLQPWDKRPVIPTAGAVNTLGEVPDSTWYTNRHGTTRMTLDELARGATNGNAPSTDRPWTVVNGKTEGATPGFLIQDGSGRRYVLKFDPAKHAGLTTGADVVGSRFFHALGYFVPENYIVRFRRAQLVIGPKATFVDQDGRERALTDFDVDFILSRVPRTKEGEYRALASLFVAGEILGPFLYFGTRSDDPNDIVAHEDRRDLRGMHVFAAWLNHYDTTSLNTLDTVVEDKGVKAIRHYLIDFGSMLGSSALGPRSPRDGYIYQFELWPSAIQLFTLGLRVPAWQRARYPQLPEAGRFESKVFEPEAWRPIYPNPAFESRQPDDCYWAAKKVMAFRDEEIRAIVTAGEYSDPRSAEWIANVLIERRDKIGRAYFSAVLPLENFQVTGGELEFEDLGVTYGYWEPRLYGVEWWSFDNAAGRRGERLSNLSDARTASYATAEIRRQRKAMAVYFRRETDGWRLVGIDRSL
jgi:hypothetical protein